MSLTNDEVISNFIISQPWEGRLNAPPNTTLEISHFEQLLFAGMGFQAGKFSNFTTEMLVTPILGWFRWSRKDSFNLLFLRDQRGRKKKKE